MKNPPADVVSDEVNVEERVATSHVVRTEMSWQVWVPVGSSSRITRRGMEALVWVSFVLIRERRLPGQIGGREERVSFREIGWGSVDILD